MTAPTPRVLAMRLRRLGGGLYDAGLEAGWIILCREPMAETARRHLADGLAWTERFFAVVDMRAQAGINMFSILPRADVLALDIDEATCIREQLIGQAWEDE